MASVVLKEIASVKAFFVSRKETRDNDAALRKSFADTLLKLIRELKVFGPNEAGQIQTALDGAPYGEVQMHRIVDFIDHRLQEAPTAVATAGGRGEKPNKSKTKGFSSGKQLLKHWWNYQTSDDLAFYRNSKNSLHSKMARLVERSMSVGCNDPSEQSLKWALAFLLLMHYTELPAAKIIFEKLQDLKAVYESEVVDFFHEHIDEFPESPQGLSDAVFKEAYPDASKPPTPIVLSGINTVASRIPLRGNHKSIKAPVEEGRKKTQDAFANVPLSISDSAPTRESGPSETCDKEATIRREYEAKLAELRAQRVQHGTLGNVEMTASGAQPSNVFEGMHVTKNKDGSILLVPLKSVKSEQPVSSVQRTMDERVQEKSPRHEGHSSDAREEPPRKTLKIERSADGILKVERVAKFEPSLNQPSAAADEPTIEDLDPHSRAAIEALDARNVRKKEEAKKRPAAAKCTADKTSSAGAGKKANRKADKAGSASTKGKPSKAEVEAIMTKAKIMKVMPSKLGSNGKNPKPVAYKGGCIYTSFKARKFRALKVRGDYYSEAQASWGQKAPSAKAWKKCVEAIDKHGAGK